MKARKRITGILLMLCMALSVGACTPESTASTENAGSDPKTESSAEGSAAETGPVNFNATGFPIVKEPITLTAWMEGGSDVDYTKNTLLKEWAEKTGITLEITTTTTADALQKRNIMFASGDYTDILLTDWNAIISKSDVMQYAVKEKIIVPVTQYIEKYGNNLKRIYEEHPNYKDSTTTPDGEIYGVARFSECYHCSAYPKFYIRQDWLDKLKLKMPTTTDELKTVLTAFVNDDPNGNGEKDEIGLLGATTWNTMSEYALMGMSFQTVKPDFWLSLGEDGSSIEFSPSTDTYREGLRYIKDLYDSKLIDGTSFTQKDDQLAQTTRTEPHIVGMYSADHAAMGYDNANTEEAKNYQIMPPVKGPSGFQKQGQNANEGEVKGFHAVITDACENPEAAYRFIDELFLDDETSMIRSYGPQGEGWDYAPEGTKNVFGDEAKYLVLSSDQSDAAKEARKLKTFSIGPQADLSAFRLSMLPSVDDVYLTENYEQRITKDTDLVEKYIPKQRLQNFVFTPVDMIDEYAEIQANLNTFVRSATVQFITGERDIETGWDQYKSELDGYKVNRYIEIYKASAPNPIIDNVPVK